ncbi:hypothetical protein ACFRCG_12560 [Embleya sp. NPDC056575]|uniref:hypothetical protein n=1 Tax=unclassified Embleya TaxID=2699296 RepID=UPI0036C36BFA
MTRAELAPRGTGLVEAEVVPAYGAADFELPEETVRRVLRGRSGETVRAYTRDWEAFELWCATARDRSGRPAPRVALPTTWATLAAYVTHLVIADYAPSTIRRAMYAVCARHRADGVPIPDTTTARKVIDDHQRERADRGLAKRKAPPLRVEALRAAVATCDTDTLAGLRDRVILVLGFALMGRRSEIVALDLDDVSVEERGLLVRILSSKTDRKAEGVVVAIPRGRHLDVDPVRAVSAWCTALAERGVTTGRLVRSIGKGASPSIGASLSDHHANRIVRKRAVLAAVPSAHLVTTHSLRSGGATAAADGGASVHDIAVHGRWSPNSPVVHEYVRRARQFHENVLDGVL